MIAILILGIIVYGFSRFSEPPESAPGGLIIEPDIPDLYGEDITFTEFREDGRFEYQLTATTISQFASQRLTKFTAPSLDLATDRAGSPWAMRAKFGFLRQRQRPDGTFGDVVFLRQEVTMQQSHPKHGLTTMRTDSIYMYPDKQYAETDQGVMIDTPAGRTTAAAMRADLLNGTVFLSASEIERVHTIVLPEQFKKP